MHMPVLTTIDQKRKNNDDLRYSKSSEMSPFNRQYRLPVHISQKLPIVYSVFEI